MSEELKPDLCVVGAGAGGAAVASAAAALGASVVLVEKDRMGGAHLHAGGVALQGLLAASRAAKTLQDAGRFGFPAAECVPDVSVLRAQIARIVAAEARNYSTARFEAMRVRVVSAPGKFLSPQVLEAGSFAIKARRFVIATGSSAAAPQIPGIELVRFWTTDDLFALPHVPRRLVVLGAQAVGLTLAQAFRRLGSEVTVIDLSPALASFDPELSCVALDHLGREGVVMHAGVEIEKIEPLATGLRVRLADGAVLDATDLLVAGGRAPNVGGLGLEAARVTFGRRGIDVDGRLRTSNSRIYAIGDVTGLEPSAFAAQMQAGLVIRTALLGMSATYDESLTPRVVWTDPGLATVGLDEAAARARHSSVRVLRAPLPDLGGTAATGVACGHVKLIADRNGVLLGASIAGPQAAEQTGLWQAALARRMSVLDIAGLALPAPTCLEASRQAALGAYAAKLRNPWLGRLLRMMRLRG